MQYLDPSKMNDMLSIFFNSIISKKINDCESSVNLSENGAVTAQVIFNTEINLEEAAQQITVEVCKYMNLYITDILNLQLSDVNRNVNFYESEIIENKNMILFRWSC